MPSASITHRLSIDAVIDPPATRRENKSSTMERSRKPSPVGMSLTSASLTSLGFVAVKSRSKTLSATGNSWSESVVPTRNLRWEIARMPSDFIASATAWTQHLSPPSASTVCTRGDPE